MLAEIGFAIAPQTGGKAALEWHNLAVDQIVDVFPDPNGLAIVRRKAYSLSNQNATADWPTWETAEAIAARIANAPIGASGVLASAEDIAAAEAAHDA